MRLRKLFTPSAYEEYFRARTLRRTLGHIGANVQFDPRSTVTMPEHVRIGDNVFIGELAHIAGHITIGDNVMFGARPILIGGSHEFAVQGKSVRTLQPRRITSVTIEREVWCGACVIVVGPVTIGMGSVIGAGGVVVKDIPPYVVAVGNPCVPVARIFDDATLRTHLTALGLDAAAQDEILRRRADFAHLRSIDRTEIP